MVPIKCPQRMKTSKIKHGRSRGGWRGWRGWRGFLCCAQMAVFLTRIDLRSTCKECPKNVQRMSKECPKNVKRMSKECQKNVQRMSKEPNRTKNAKQTPPRHHLLRSILPKISATHAWLSLSTRCRSRPPLN